MSTHFIRDGSDESALLGCLMETMHQGITIIDADLNVVLLNAAARRLLNFPDDAIGDNPTLEDLIRFNAKRGDYGPGDPEEQVRLRLDRARRFEPHDFERVRPDGTMLRIQGTPAGDGGFVTIYTDVTRERTQERELNDVRAHLEERLDDRTRELQDSRDLLLNAINAVKDGMGISDPRGRVMLANDRMRQIYPGVDERIKEGIYVPELLKLIFPDEPEIPFEELINRAGPSEEKRFPDGKWYRIDRTLTPDGGIISVYADVTEYKQQQATLMGQAHELVKLLNQEKRLSELQRDFVSMASHEFRTPLAIIDSNAQRLIRRSDKLEQSAILERGTRIRDSVGRMQYLINRFLNFTRSQAGDMEIDSRDQPVKVTVSECCRRFQDSCSSHRIVLDTGNLPEILRFDRKLLELCIDNLLSNAVKYSPDAAEIRVTGHADGNWAAICVEDDGLGIPETEHRKVFDRYFRASTSSGIAGTGIGLNMISMIMDKHRGKVDLESRVGEGTRVTLRLPVAQEDAGEWPERAPLRRSATSA
ncbi:PAS-domain containing protein [uncultured Roseibium sp.]|uniref:sensor histidine kinase n=1 Tax=uncultured Roseibium sp. TaxID=1936171 RepID=UPI003217A13C